MPSRTRSPKPTAQRLSLYLRALELHMGAGERTVSSGALGQGLGLPGAQVRKDLAYFGQFGQPGVGYSVEALSTQLRRIMGTDRHWPMGLVGVGNIGRALLAYRRFHQEGFKFVAAFDHSPEVVGQEAGSLRVLGMESLRAEVRAKGIRIGVIATPGDAAQTVADQLVAAGVSGILNFAPRRLRVPVSVRVGTVDFTVALEQLAFGLSPGSGKAGA